MRLIRKLLLIIVLFPGKMLAQNSLTFNKRFVECENQWVAFQMSKDSTYSFGFIYIDEQAGVTFDLRGYFSISGNNFWVPHKIGDSMGSIKYRLQPNQVRVALIPSGKFGELQITAKPDWLKFYQTDTSSVKHLFRWGFLYNSWDLCTKALTYLERARAIDPSFKGLAFELGYAYNALSQFDKALLVLKQALDTSSKDCLLFKELAYAQMHLGHLNDAAVTCRKGIESCTDNDLKCEISFNLAYQYYLAKDTSNFNIWAAEVKKWAKPGDRFITNINKLLW